MVIYQKQHRLAHRQYCVPLSESRLTRFPPPSKKAFFPSSHIFHVNSKCIIKTLFSSKCSSINFRDWLHWKGRDEKISALERGTDKVAVLPGSGAAAAEPAQFAGAPLSTAGRSQTWLLRGLTQASQRVQSRADPSARYPGRDEAGGKSWLLPRHPDLEGWMNVEIIPIPSSPAFSNLVAHPTCTPAEQSRWCLDLC